MTSGTVRCGACPWVVAVLPDRWVWELLGHWARAHDKSVRHETLARQCDSRGKGNG